MRDIRPGTVFGLGALALAGMTEAQPMNPIFAPIAARIRATGHPCTAVVASSEQEAFRYLPHAALSDGHVEVATCAGGARYLVVLPARVEWRGSSRTPWERADIRPLPGPLPDPPAGPPPAGG